MRSLGQEGWPSPFYRDALGSLAPLLTQSQEISALAGGQHEGCFRCLSDIVCSYHVALDSLVTSIESSCRDSASPSFCCLSFLLPLVSFSSHSWNAFCRCL